jgi:hypothetical protein
MSNTDFLRSSEADLLPEGYVQGHIVDLRPYGHQGSVELDGWHPERCEAIEICQSEAMGESPKPGQKRKLASDILKLAFLCELGVINRGRIYVTCEELYTWFHAGQAWIAAAARLHGITVELRRHSSKLVRKRVRNTILGARREMFTSP